MNHKLNPTLVCHNSGCPARTLGPQAEYCSLKCRDAAKRKRRRERERGLVVEDSPVSNSFGQATPETLSLVAAALLDGSMQSPVWFTDASPWQAPKGVLWEVLADGSGKLSLA